MAFFARIDARASCLLGLFLAAQGCVPQRPVSCPPPGHHGRFNLLTVDEVAAYPDALSALKVMRRSWLTGRSNPPRPPQLYIDGILVHSLDVLSGIPSRSVAEIRYLQSYEATNRYGPGSQGGAIEVLTRR